MSMYPEKLDQKERDLVSEALLGVVHKVERALDLIELIYGMNFESLDGSEDLRKEEVTSFLYTAKDLLFDALLEYNLTIGNREWYGVEPFLEEIEAIKDVICVNGCIKE